MKKCEVLLFVLLLVIGSLGISMAETAPVTKAPDSAHVMSMERPRLDGLKQFHEVLAPIWHTYLPEKNYKAVRESVEPFKKAVDIIMNAPIPDFYQHKKEQIESGRKAILDAVAEFETTARGTDDAQLEKVSEKVHTAFENLARTLAPRMSEIDKFHLVLYPLWHQALPKSDWASIKATAPLLKAKMDSLVAAPVPEWAKEKEKVIIEQRASLEKAVNEFAAVCQAGKDAEIKDKLTLVHQHFMALDGVFE